MPPRSATTSRRSRGAAVFRPHPQRRHLDLHYGNGTASLAATRPWIHALSIYGNDYWENKPFRDVTIRRHTDGAIHLSIPIIPSGLSDRDMMLEILTSALPWILAGEKADILLYQAGADPLKDDPCSPLNLTHDDLRERDRIDFPSQKSTESRLPGSSQADTPRTPQKSSPRT